MTCPRQKMPGKACPLREAIIIPETGFWKQDEQGQILLDNGLKLPPQSVWGTAKTYCAIYPSDCRAQDGAEKLL